MSDGSPIAAFRAGLDAMAPADFADVLGLLEADGQFEFDRAQLEAIAGSTLADGPHTLHLQAQDAFGNASAVFDLTFVLDTQAPVIQAFDLATASDTAPVGDQQTTAASVGLEGTTEPLAAVALVGTGLATTADGAGDFGFDDILLDLGPNEFTALATDVAGNASEFSLTITRLAEGEDTEPPQVTAALANDTGASAGDSITSDPAIAGQVTDASALLAVLVGLDGMAPGAFSDVLGDLGADGTFALTRARLEEIAGAPLADGAHTVHILAQDVALNTSSIVDVAFELDTAAPALTVEEPADGATVAPGAELSGAVDGTGSAVASVLYTLGALPPIAVALGPTGAFGQPLALAAVEDGAQSLAIEATDLAGNVATASLDLIVDTPFILTAHAPLDGMEEVGVRARPRIDFSKAVDAATVTGASFFATAGGEAVPATIVVSNGGEHAWLYATGGLPGGAEVEITVAGGLIQALDGEVLDGDGDGAPGGIARFTFTTGSVVALEGTTLSGRVLDVGPDFLPLTADDVEAGPDGQVGTEDDVFLNPVAGAPVFLLGLEGDVMFTDATGRFQFEAVPAGEVKVVIDGQEVAAPGVNFPEVVLDVRMDVATANDLGAIYLPRLGADAYAGVNAAQETVLTLSPGSALGLTEEQRQQFTLTVAPNSLLSADGQRVAGGEVGLGVVPVEVLAALLPAGLPTPALAFTIQTRGFTDFAEPARLTLPNLTGAAPGTEFLLLTFDHTTKQLINEGTVVATSAPGTPLTVALNAAAAEHSLSDFDVADVGDSVEFRSLPGLGFTSLCFHLLVPTGSPTGPPCEPIIAADQFVMPVFEDDGTLKDYLFAADAGEFTLHFENAAQRIDPSRDACDPVNAQASPLRIEMTVEGPAERSSRAWARTRSPSSCCPVRPPTSRSRSRICSRRRTSTPPRSTSCTGRR